MTARKRSKGTSGAGASTSGARKSATKKRAMKKGAATKSAATKTSATAKKSAAAKAAATKGADERRTNKRSRAGGGAATGDVASQVEVKPPKPAPKRGTTRRTPVFDPSRLDRTVIALPLVERFKEQVAARYGATPPEKRRYPVVIDLNLDYHDGRDVARQAIIDEIAELLTSDASGDEKARQSIRDRLTRTSPMQYVAARLTESEVIALVRRDVDQADNQWSQRRIYRIWPDFEVQACLTKSPMTVKADAAHIAFNARGRDIVWAVMDSGIDGTHPHFALIQGVNLSLGYDFDPEWFACGQSPLCVEVDRLVRSGVVVVVAAGNSGFGYLNSAFTNVKPAGMALTINDPGNAETAITVGSTHREMPHLYGASYFSSKGPTGDGRVKPDLLAPGEKILSCAAGTKKEEIMARGRSAGSPSVKSAPDRQVQYIEDSGTSMAAPHVSGAIAAFLSVRREFQGQPERVKSLFLENATNLNRDRYFQGHGLVDLMRTIQSV